MASRIAWTHRPGALPDGDGPADPTGPSLEETRSGLAARAAVLATLARLLLVAALLLLARLLCATALLLAALTRTGSVLLLLVREHVGHAEAHALQQRALNQAARELLLAQSSDWAFLMQQKTAQYYAAQRTTQHLQRFTRLYDDLCANEINDQWLGEIEARDNLFPTLDYRVYR